MEFKGIEICCPHCKGELQEIRPSEIQCNNCSRRFPITLGIPDFRIFPDPYMDNDADRDKGLFLAQHSGPMTFEELVDFYYQNTKIVPQKHAQQYKRGLMGGVYRSQAALKSWEGEMLEQRRANPGSLLEIGCGTAPFLVAAAPHYDAIVGVDIAFRWLVVGKKRLQEAGLDLPLICACAEALPFPDRSFQRVVAESTLEHVRDPERSLIECHRVLVPSGKLFISTPNRFSLGPDPQIGVWGGGYLPDPVVRAIARWQGAFPPQRTLLTKRSLSDLMLRMGFSSVQLFAPKIAAGHRQNFPPLTRALIDLYQGARRLPLLRAALEWIGPLLYATAEAPNQKNQQHQPISADQYSTA